MNSTLPNFPAARAIPASAPINSAAPADLPAASANGTDFAALIAPPTSGTPAPAAAPTGAAVTTGAANIRALGVCAEEPEAIDEVSALLDTEADASAGPSRDTMEQAAALISMVMQTLVPEATPTLPDADVSLGGGSQLSGQTTSTLSAENAEGGMSSRSAVGRQGRGEHGPFAFSGHHRHAAKEAAAENLVSASPANANSTAEDVKSSRSEAAQLEVSRASDGALEIEWTGASKKGEAETDDAASLTVAVSGELDLPGHAVVRFSAKAGLPGQRGEQGEQAKAIFAAHANGEKAMDKTTTDVIERKFLNTDDESLKMASETDGIGVAKRETNMSTTLHHDQAAFRTSDAAQAFRMDAPAVSAPVADTAKVDAPAGLNLAERAVATVTNLVETQFSVSMQKSGSVQLRMKFGSEDLDVRVELRGGAVHTAFRTNSDELRAAITREWQTVAAQSPDQMRRYLEPVFAPSASSSTSGDSSQQQGARQQQQASNQDLPQRAPRVMPEDVSPFSHHSLLRESFFPTPAAPRVPTVLPTSVRLSALA